MQSRPQSPGQQAVSQKRAASPGLVRGLPDL